MSLYIALCSTTRGRYDRPEPLDEWNDSMVACADAFWGEMVQKERDPVLNYRQHNQEERDRQCYQDGGKNRH